MDRLDLFGLTVARTADRSFFVGSSKRFQALQPIMGAGRTWSPIVREPFAGAWQQDQECTIQNVTAHVAVFACVSLIASDVGKTRLMLTEEGPDGVTRETENPAYSPFLRKPNGFQIRQQFFERWQTSKLLEGNTYVLKRRDLRGVVNAGYVLDPARVRVLQAPDTSVFYQLTPDPIGGVGEGVLVPAREIIHDTYWTISHPLIGVSPIWACGRAAIQGLTIQAASVEFFANANQPAGILTAPGPISQDVADRAKEKWTSLDTGAIAVLGYGLTYQPIGMKAQDSQLLDQLKFSAEMVCQAYRVPLHKISVGAPPNYNNIQALDTQYYTNCLQEKLEKVETLLEEGLEIQRPLRVEFDLDDLLRMDTATLIQSEKDAAGIKTVNESRRRLNLAPVTGGNTVYLQEQNFSIEALARRDEAPAPSAPMPTPEPPALEPIPPGPPASKGIAWEELRIRTLARLAPVVQTHAA
jgi:HK97 family phage portal protein